MAASNPSTGSGVPFTGGFIGSYNFRVTVAGLGTRTDFLKVSPVAHETEEIAFRHGTDRWVRKGAGRHIAPELVLERVYSGVSEFSDWRDRIILGNDERKQIKVEYLDPYGNVVASYLCHHCWPKKWELPELDAGSSNAAIEKITLAVEQVTKETVVPGRGTNQATG